MDIHPRHVMGSARHVLDDVPRVSFDSTDGDVELCTFPSCLRACLQYLHRDLPYWYLMAVSGAAFRTMWHTEGWEGGPLDLVHLCEDPQTPFRRALKASGFRYEIFGNKDTPHPVADGVELFRRYEDEAYFRRDIMRSIADWKRPVLAFGVVGPPECCLLCGFDDHADVVMGWSFYQDYAEFADEVALEPNGYFRRRDWFQHTPGMIVLTDLRDPPAPRETFLLTLRWAVELVRMPIVHQHLSGLAAYTAWADALEQDQYFPANDAEVLSRRLAQHEDAMMAVAEGRWCAAQFLRWVADQARDMAPELRSAATCYEAEHGPEGSLIYASWELLGGSGSGLQQQRQFAQPETRRLIARLIRQARDLDAEAIDHIERALSR